MGTTATKSSLKKSSYILTLLLVVVLVVFNTIVPSSELVKGCTLLQTHNSPSYW